MKLLVAAFLALVVVLLSTTGVWAIAPPDSGPTLDSITVWRHYLETNDLLVLARYNVPYVTPPTLDIDETFLFRFLNPSGAEINSSVPYAYFENNGYEQGVVTLYLTAAQVTAASISWAGAGYSVRLSGNPSLAWSPTFPSVSSTALSWQSLGTHAETAEALGTTILAHAQQLSNAWDIALLIQGAEGTVLSTFGDTYFTGSFNLLRSAVPQIFSAVIEQPVFREETFSQSYANTLSNQVSWVRTAFNSLADDFGLSRGYISLAIALGAAGFFIYLGITKLGSAVIGMVAAAAVLVALGRLGLVSLTALGIMALFATLLITYLFFFRRA